MKCLTTEQTKLELRSGNQLGGVAQRPGKVLFHTFKPVILFFSSLLEYSCFIMVC